MRVLYEGTAAAALDCGTALVVGPKVLLLFPVWLIGCLAHDVYQRRSESARLAAGLNRMLAGAVAIATGLVLAMRLNHGLLRAALVLRIEMYEASQRLKLGMSGGGLSFYLIGVVGCAVFLRLLLVARRFEIRPDTKAVRAVRFISEGTFPIYLLHFPLYVLMAACIPYNHAALVPKGLMLGTVLAVGVFAGYPCNVLKNRLRSLKVERAKVETTA